MKINLKNISYPKPILSELVDDYKNNTFNIKIVKQEYDKKNQILSLDIDATIENEYIQKLIDENQVAIILHLEQKTQRELSILKYNCKNTKKINLYKYSTDEAIEVIGILYTISDFALEDKSILNDIYSLVDDDVIYNRGDILGYSNELQINLPEDKRIGSIFNLNPDTENVLTGQPFKVLLNSDLIQIIMNEDIHQKYISLYKKDQYVKRLMFFNIVEPAIISAYTEMFMSYELYKDKKWCRTLAMKVEKILKIPSDEIFDKNNYDIDKVYKYTNYALGDLFKDAIEIYSKGFGE